MHNINLGSKGGRLISSFNLGGQGCPAGTGAYYIYDNHGGSTCVSQSTYNTYNSNYKKSTSVTKSTSTKNSSIKKKK